MKLFEVHIIPHAEQRYDTAGDWVMGVPETGTPHVLYISDLGNRDAEFLCAMHELTEMWLCLMRRIPQESVDAFDQRWEPYAENPDEPGCDPQAPYHAEHEAGEVIERVLCSLMRIDWHHYNDSFSVLERS